MWKSLRAAVEDGVKDFSREAITEFNTTLSDVSHLEHCRRSTRLLRAQRIKRLPLLLPMWHVHVSYDR